MRKANISELLHTAINVVEAHQAYRKAIDSQDGTQQRYLDSLESCLFNLRLVIERDRPWVAARIR